MTPEFRAGACPTCGGDGSIRNVNPQWLREQRQRAGVTLRALGDAVGFSAMYLCDIEHGRRAVPAKIHEAYRALREATPPTRRKAASR